MNARARSIATTISDKTKITIPLVVSVVGLAVWLAGISFQSSANTKDIDSLKQKQDKMNQMAEDIATIKQAVADIKEGMK